nr:MULTISPECIES: RNA polymerase sigma factor region1.1 domain-containing protein [unclassified Myxococcus]
MRPKGGDAVENRIGKSYVARKALFAKGLKEGRLTVQEIEEALPAGTLTAAERWLLYYSLRAAQVEIIDEVTGQIDHGFMAETPAPQEH